jgi:hypothetical protein
MRLGLLKTAGLGRLKTADSAYKKPNPHASIWNRLRNRLLSNYANSKEYFVFFLTQRHSVDKTPDAAKYHTEKPPHLLRYTTTPFAAGIQSSRKPDAKERGYPGMAPGGGR